MEQIKGKLVVMILALIVGLTIFTIPIYAEEININYSPVYHIKEGGDIRDETAILCETGSIPLSYGIDKDFYGTSEDYYNYTYKNLVKTTGEVGVYDGKQIKIRSVSWVYAGDNEGVSSAGIDGLNRSIGVSSKVWGTSQIIAVNSGSGDGGDNILFNYALVYEYDVVEDATPIDPEDPEYAGARVKINIHYMLAEDEVCVKTIDESKRLRETESRYVGEAFEIATMVFENRFTIQAGDGKYYTYEFCNSHTMGVDGDMSDYLGNVSGDHKGRVSFYIEDPTITSEESKAEYIPNPGENFVRQIKLKAHKEIDVIAEYRQVGDGQIGVETEDKETKEVLETYYKLSETKTTYKLTHLTPGGKAVISSEREGLEEYNNLYEEPRYFGIPTSAKQYVRLMDVSSMLYELEYAKVEGNVDFNRVVEITCKYPGGEYKKSIEMKMKRAYEYYEVKKFNGYYLTQAKVINKTLTADGYVDFCNSEGADTGYIDYENTNLEELNTDYKINISASSKSEAKEIVEKMISEKGYEEEVQRATKVIVKNDVLGITIGGEKKYIVEDDYDWTTSEEEKAKTKSPEDTASTDAKADFKMSNVEIPTTIKNNIYESKVYLAYKKIMKEDIEEELGEGTGEKDIVIKELKYNEEEDLYVYEFEDVNSVVVHTPVYIEEKGLTGVKETQVVYGVEGQGDKKETIKTKVTTNRTYNVQEVLVKGQGPEGFNESKGVNAPLLSEGMVGVYWDESGNEILSEINGRPNPAFNYDKWYSYTTNNDIAKAYNEYKAKLQVLYDESYNYQIRIYRYMPTDQRLKIEEQIAEVQGRIEKLNSDNAQVVEKYNNAKYPVWANAKTIADGSYWVWIPRYAYCMTDGDTIVTQRQWEGGDDGRGWIPQASHNHNIEFLKGRTNESTTGRTEYQDQRGRGNWLIHPAFSYTDTDGQKVELTGIWVSKYPMSAEENGRMIEKSGDEDTSSKLKIVSKDGGWITHQYSQSTYWKGISVSQAFKNALNYDTGIGNKNLESHLIKQMEMGAVSYFMMGDTRVANITSNFYYNPWGGNYWVHRYSTVGEYHNYYWKRGTSWDIQTNKSGIYFEANTGYITSSWIEKYIFDQYGGMGRPTIPAVHDMYKEDAANPLLKNVVLADEKYKDVYQTRDSYYYGPPYFIDKETQQWDQKSYGDNLLETHVYGYYGCGAPSTGSVSGNAGQFYVVLWGEEASKGKLQYEYIDKELEEVETIEVEKKIYDLELDEEYKIELNTMGIHRNTQGYGLDRGGNENKKDYVEWVNNRQVEVSFPIDVYVKEGDKYKFYKKETWIKLGIPKEKKEEEPIEVTFKIPVWVKEDMYAKEEITSGEELRQTAIVVRAVAENDPDANGKPNELGRYVANYIKDEDKDNDDVLYIIESYDYRVYDFIQINVVGKVEGFKVEYTDDSGYKYTMQNSFSGIEVKELPFGQKGDNVINKNSNYGIKLGYKIKYTLITKGERSKEVQITPYAYFVGKNEEYASRLTSKKYEELLVPIDIYYQVEGNRYEKLGEGSSKIQTTTVEKNGELPIVDNSLKEWTKKVYEAYGKGNLKDYPPKYNYSDIKYNIAVGIGTIGEIRLGEQVRLRYNAIEKYVAEKVYGERSESELKKEAGSEENFAKSMSKWYGEFSLPSTTRIVEKGQSLYNSNGKMQHINMQEDIDGYIIVFFEIKTIDEDGKEYLSYQLPKEETINKWLQEGYMSEAGFITLPNAKGTKVGKEKVEAQAKINEVGAAVVIYEAFITKEGNVVGKN